MQPGIVAAGERILSFISSFHCFFRQKKIFFLKKAAINTYIKNKKIKTAKNAGGKEILLPEEALEKLNRYLLELSMDWFKNTKGEADWKVYKENGQIIIKPAAAKKKS